MNRELVLAGGAGVVVVLAVAVAVATPGVVAEPDRFERPSHLQVEELPITASEVSGATVTLHVEPSIAHRGGPAEKVSVRVRATDSASGLKVAEVTRDVGTVETDGEQVVPLDLTVERRGGYDIEVAVFADGERVETVTRTVEGVGSLQPAYARTNVTFRQFDRTQGIPSVEFSIADETDGRATLAVSSYVTNQGDDDASGLELVVKARQADSNIVADETRVDVGGIAAGQTATPRADLVVPTEYNYYLDAFLVKDGVIVDTTRTAANLHPTERISVNETQREIGLEVSDFDRGNRRGSNREEPADGSTPTSGPGFGVAAAVVALLGAALFARRWSA